MQYKGRITISGYLWKKEIRGRKKIDYIQFEMTLTYIFNRADCLKPNGII